MFDEPMAAAAAPYVHGGTNQFDIHHAQCLKILEGRRWNSGVPSGSFHLVAELSSRIEHCAEKGKVVQ